jgi:hypothetical protein
MTLSRSWRRMVRSTVLMAGLVAVLGGCVVYADGGPWHGHYGHERNWR